MILFDSIRKKESAFSLTELTVALLVVSVLVGLLYGALQKVRERTKPAKELATFRQLGAVVHLYLNDNNGRFPNSGSPIAVKTYAHYLGFTNDVKDWHNTNDKDSLFRNGANEAAIRGFFKSAYDDRKESDPISSFSANHYIGLNPSEDPENYGTSSNVKTYREVRRPNSIIYFVPGYFLAKYQQRFSGATPNNPFRNPNNAVEKGFFPALFVDGHVEMVDPNPKDMTLYEINRKWLTPRAE